MIRSVLVFLAIGMPVAAAACDGACFAPQVGHAYRYAMPSPGFQCGSVATGDDRIRLTNAMTMSGVRHGGSPTIASLKQLSHYTLSPLPAPASDDVHRLLALIHGKYFIAASALHEDLVEQDAAYAGSPLAAAVSAMLGSIYEPFEADAEEEKVLSDKLAAIKKNLHAQIRALGDAGRLKSVRRLVSGYAYSDRIAVLTYTPAICTLPLSEAQRSRVLAAIRAVAPRQKGKAA